MAENEVSPQVPAESVTPAAALGRVLLEPKATFSALREKSPWILPFLLMVVAVIVMGYVTWPYQIDQRMEMIQLNENISPEMRAGALEQMRESRDTPVIWQLAIGPVFLAVFWIISAGVWLMVGNVVLGGNATFKQIWSTFNYANMVTFVEMIIKGTLVLVKGSASVYTSLALLVPDMNPTTFTFRALDGVDVFALWFFAVMGIGISAVCKVKTQKAVVTSLVVWAVYVFGVKAGLGSLVGGLFGM